MTDYTIYQELMRKIADVNNAAGVLNWDQETYMPANGAEIRAQQLSTLSGIAHELSTSEQLGAILNKLSFDSSLNEKQKRNIKTSLKNYNEHKKYTTAFIKELSKTISETFQAWQKAKETSDFKLYAPYLEKLVRLKREECKLLGYSGHPYDALLDQYEPGAKTADVEMLYTAVRSQLVDFIKQIASKPQNKDDFMFTHFEKEK